MLSVCGIDPGPLENAAKPGHSKNNGCHGPHSNRGSDLVDVGYEYSLPFQIIISTSKIHVRKPAKYHPQSQVIPIQVVTKIRYPTLRVSVKLSSCASNAFPVPYDNVMRFSLDTAGAVEESLNDFEMLRVFTSSRRVAGGMPPS